MGLVINQRVIHNAAYHGKRVIGMVYYGWLVYKSNMVYFKIDPNDIKFDNDLYQQSKVFLVIAADDWEIEELL